MQQSQKTIDLWGSLSTGGDKLPQRSLSLKSCQKNRPRDNYAQTNQMNRYPTITAVRV